MNITTYIINLNNNEVLQDIVELDNDYDNLSNLLGLENYYEIKDIDSYMEDIDEFHHPTN